MAITPGAYNEIVIGWINQKWPPNNPCPMCHTTSGWELSAPGEIPIRQDVEGTPLGKAVAVVPLTCNNCGNIVLLNAIKIGAIAPASES